MKTGPTQGPVTMFQQRYCIYAYTKAQEYCYTTPLPGQEQNGEGGDENIPY